MWVADVDQLCEIAKEGPPFCTKISTGKSKFYCNEKANKGGNLNKKFKELTERSNTHAKLKRLLISTEKGAGA